MFLFLLVYTEFSGRSLATLLVAWVGAAVIASVLLRWKYMWIVLAVLTLLFLLVCGYTAYNAKRAHERAVRSINDAARLESSESAFIDTEIFIISGRVSDDGGVTTESPRYQEAWLTADMPPSYVSVIREPPTARTILSHSVAKRDDERSFPDPPPYSIVARSEQ